MVSYRIYQAMEESNVHQFSSGLNWSSTSSLEEQIVQDLSLTWKKTLGTTYVYQIRVLQ